MFMKIYKVQVEYSISEILLHTLNRATWMWGLLWRDFAKCNCRGEDSGSDHWTIPA